MNYISSTTFSLRELALTQIALQLIHHSQALKNEIFCLTTSTIESNSDISEEEGYDLSKAWEKAVEQHLSQLSDRIPLPSSLKPKLLISALRTAMECLNWAKHKEALFGISRRWSADFLRATDWKLDGSLRERSVALRLTQCESIDVYQRYKIACVYFLEQELRDLWNLMTTQNRQMFIVYRQRRHINELSLVKLWSIDLAQNKRIPIDEHYLRLHGMKRAVKAGLMSVVRHCWEKMSQDRRRKYIIHNALKATAEWVKSKTSYWVHKLFTSVDYPHFYSPAHFNQIIHYFLSQMSEEQKLTFFTRALQSADHEKVLECFIDWPYQDFLLPTMKMVWNILPEPVYSRLIIALVIKYTSSYQVYYVNQFQLFPDKESLDYNYGSLLLKFLDQASKHYRSYLIIDQRTYIFEMLLQILEKNTFNNEDFEIVRSILNIASFKETRAINQLCVYFEQVCHKLLQTRNLTLLQIFLEKCLNKDEISDYKKKLIFSGSVMSDCVRQVALNRAEFVESIFIWGSLTTGEISFLKRTSLFQSSTNNLFVNLIHDQQFDHVGRIINYFLFYLEDQQIFKYHLMGQCRMLIFRIFLTEEKWKELDRFLAWSFVSETWEDQMMPDIFTTIGDLIKSFVDLIKTGPCPETELFCRWGQLSRKQIHDLRKDSTFPGKPFETLTLADMLCSNESIGQFLNDGGKWQNIALKLYSYFSDEEMMLFFEKAYETIFQNNNLQLNENWVPELQYFNKVIKQHLTYILCTQ